MSEVLTKNLYFYFCIITNNRCAERNICNKEFQKWFAAVNHNPEFEPTTSRNRKGEGKGINMSSPQMVGYTDLQ